MENRSPWVRQFQPLEPLSSMVFEPLCFVTHHGNLLLVEVTAKEASFVRGLSNGVFHAALK